MTKLKTEQETRKYIQSLESQLLALKKSHSFRLGSAIVNYYKGPKFIGLKRLIKELKESTKKINVTLLRSELVWPKPKVVLSEKYINTYDYNRYSQSKEYEFYYYTRTYKNKNIQLSFSTEIRETLEEIQFPIKPNDFEYNLYFFNADKIIIDLKDVEDNPLWRGFGTFDEAELTMKFIKAVEESGISFENRVLIGHERLRYFPVLLQNIAIFNLVEGKM